MGLSEPGEADRIHEEKRAVVVEIVAHEPPETGACGDAARRAGCELTAPTPA